MDQTTDAGSTGSEATSTPIAIAPAPAGDKSIDARSAARDLASWRHNRDKRNQQQQQDGQQCQPPAQSAPAAAPAADPALESTAQAGDAGDLRSARDEGGSPGEITSADPAAILPSIEPPRSWTKEDKELFTNLPRATQERIAERERLREGDFNRRQQKATEEAQALEAARMQAEQTRLQYEAMLPQLLLQLQQEGAGEFADIRTIEDLQGLATDDPYRFGRWQAQNMRVTAVTQQIRDAQQRQENESRQKFVDFAKRQDDLLTEKIPSLADKSKAATVQNAALAVLKDIGFSEKELNDSYNGKLGLHLRDHRFQLLVHDATMWRDAQAKAKAASAATIPPVQRPGVAQPRGTAQAVQIQNLTKRLETSGSLKDATALLRARRAARH